MPAKTTELAQLTKLIERRFDAIDEQFNSVDKRFDTIDQRLDTIDKKLEIHDKQFDAIGKMFEDQNERLDRMTGVLGGLSQDMREVKEDIATVDHRLQRLESSGGFVESFKVISKYTDLERRVKHLESKSK